MAGLISFESGFLDFELFVGLLCSVGGFASFGVFGFRVFGCMVLCLFCV